MQIAQVTFLVPFYWSLNCMSLAFRLNMNLYLIAFSITIKISICTICAYTILVCKLCLLFQIILDLWPVLILETFSSWDITKGRVSILSYFLAVFFWSTNCANQVSISSHILNIGNVLFESF